MFDTLSEKFSDAFKNISGKGKISESNIEDTLKQVRTALLEADVNFKVVKEFVNKVKEQALGEKVIKGVNPGEQFVKIMHDELAALMGEEHHELDFSRPLNPILIVGLNGAGKTTFTGKLALFLKGKKKKDVFLIPADNFRPAAKDQLIKHAKNMGIEYFDSDLSMLPKDIVKAGMEEAKKLEEIIKDRIKPKQVEIVSTLEIESYDEMTLHDLEKLHICRTLDHLEGNKTRAAKVLGITVKTLYNKLHSYGLVSAKSE
jgi:signal recognition particle GTPase